MMPYHYHKVNVAGSGMTDLALWCGWSNRGMLEMAVDDILTMHGVIKDRVAAGQSALPKVL